MGEVRGKLRSALPAIICAAGLLMSRLARQSMGELNVPDQNGKEPKLSPSEPESLADHAACRTSSAGAWMQKRPPPHKRVQGCVQKYLPSQKRPCSQLNSGRMQDPSNVRSWRATSLCQVTNSL